MVGSVQEQVDRELPILVTMSNDELQAKIGEIPLGSQLYDPGERISLPDLSAAGRRFVETNDRVRSVICDAASKRSSGMN